MTLRRNSVKLLAVSTILICALIALLCFIDPLGDAVHPPFEKVAQFSRAGQMADSFLGDIGICSDIQGVSEHMMLEQFRRHSVGKAFQVPNGQLFYVLGKKDLSLYDNLHNCLGGVSIEHLGLSPEEYSFGDVIGMTEEETWLKLERFIPASGPSMPGSDGYAVEWNMAVALSHGNFPDYKVHSLGEYLSAAVPPSSSMVYVIGYDEAGNTMRVHDVNNEEVVKVYRLTSNDKWFLSSIRATPNENLFLVSGQKGKHNYLGIFDAETGTIEPKTRADNACWLEDGYIYFNRGNQLWRLSETHKPEIIFSPQRSRTAFNWFNQLHVGSDKTVLVFDYQLELLGRRARFGRLILDLKKREYKDVNKGSASEL